MRSKNQTSIKAEPGRQELFITREFEAPRELVFRAHVEEELYSKWLGPNGYTTEFEIFQPVSGGSYRFLNKDPKGNEFVFHGVYHEVQSPERIIYTFEFDGMPEKGHVIMNTLVFEELPGERTRLNSQSVYQSIADRDGMLKSGMEKGVNEGYERFDEILEQLRHKP